MEEKDVYFRVRDILNEIETLICLGKFGKTYVVEKNKIDKRFQKDSENYFVLDHEGFINTAKSLLKDIKDLDVTTDEGYEMVEFRMENFQMQIDYMFGRIYQTIIGRGPNGKVDDLDYVLFNYEELELLNEVCSKYAEKQAYKE